jgi:hypothetical protein
MPNLLRNILATSEFWMAVGVPIGFVLVSLGTVSQATWDHIWPMMAVYIAGRLTSKAAKAAVKVKTLGGLDE